MIDLQKSENHGGWWSWPKHLLAGKPIKHYIYPGCFVNGVKFHSLARDEGRRTQNSGVAVGKDNDLYYGAIVYVVQLCYGNDVNVFLFKCRWFKRTKEDLGLLSVDTNSSWYEDEPFALATLVRQVFYLDDPKAGEGWKIVNHISHRGIWNTETIEGTPTTTEDAAEPERDIPAYQEPNISVIRSDIMDLVQDGERLPMPDGCTDLTEDEIIDEVDEEDEQEEDADEDSGYSSDDVEYDEEDEQSDTGDEDDEDYDDDYLTKTRKINW